MPLIEVSISDLERLLGRELEDSEIEDLLPRLKCEIDSVEGDAVYYEATHDRPDLFSAEGLSRGLRGLLEVEIGAPKFGVRRSGLVAKVEGPDYRPYAFLGVVYGVKLDDEAIRQIMQLQEKLHATYGRNRRKVSIGVYDLSKVTPPIIYTKARPDRVSFIPLDMDSEMTLEDILEKHPKGVEYGHLIAGREYFPLLLDSEGVVLSLPPIVNSEDTRVTESTRDVLIDVTTTDAASGLKVLAVVATSIYERGKELGTVEVVTKGGKLSSPQLHAPRMKLDREHIEGLVGLSLGEDEIVHLLRRMRFDAVVTGDKVDVVIPPYRVDILHPVDLVEEVIMAYGYDRLAPEFMPPQHPGREDSLEVFSRSVRGLVQGYGFQEVANYMMTSKEAMFEKMGLERGQVVEVENPRQETYTCLRTWIIPQLLQTLSRSKHADYPQRIFEVGDVALLDEREDNMVREERHIAMAMTDDEVSFTHLQAVLNSIMEQLGLSYKLEGTTHGSFIQGRVARIVVDSEEVGIIGEIHPRVLVLWGLEKPVVAAEMDLDRLRRHLLRG